MEGIAVRTDSAPQAQIELSLTGPLRAGTADKPDILPRLRKARAILVILALADGQTATRRWLAGLLWSRNEPAQGLARLRDTLSTLRQNLKEALGDDDLVRVTADRVSLRPGAVRVDLDAAASDPAGQPPATSDLGAELDGIDPALDDWLLALRRQVQARRSAAVPGPAQAASIPGVKRSLLVSVAPLRVIGGGQDGELASALVDEIGMSLSRVRGLRVVSGGEPGAAGAQEPGLDFTLHGSMQRLGGRLRIAVRLVEVPSGVVCWSSHFDYDHGDLFHIQQDVAAMVTAGLEPELPAIAAERMQRTGGTVDTSYLLMLRAVSLIHRLDRRSFNEAGGLLTQVIDHEPDFSAAYSWLALWHIFLVGQGWARDARASTARAGEVAEYAVMLDPSDARGLTIAGHVRAFLHRRLDEALPLHERALAINPSLPLAWNLSGVAHAYKGNIEEARRRIDYCRRLAPRDPHIFFADGTYCLVELLSRNHELAVDIGRRVTQLQPRFSAAFKPYLAALGHLNQEREAALVHRRLLQLEPDFSLRSFRAGAPFARREHMDHYAAGLTQAGVM